MLCFTQGRFNHSKYVVFSKPEQLVFKYRNLTCSCAPLVDIRCVKETFEGAFQEGDLLHHMARAFSMSPSTY